LTLGPLGPWPCAPVGQATAQRRRQWPTRGARSCASAGWWSLRSIFLHPCIIMRQSVSRE
jgi:hypothetical protein